MKCIPLKKDNTQKVICVRYWPSSYATVSKKGRLRPRDPLSIWPEHPEILPPSCRPTPMPKPRSTKRALLVVRGTPPDELSFLQQDRVNIDVISKRVLSNSNVFCCPTTSYNDGDKSIIQPTARSQAVPRFLVEIKPGLRFTAFHNGIKVTIPCVMKNRIHTFISWSA